MKTSSTVVFLGMSALTGALAIGGTLEGCRSDTTGLGGFSTTTKTGTGGTGTGGGTAQATEVTINQITDTGASGHVGPKTLVKLKGVVATSIKFLVSKGSSGTCLWGVFLSTPGLTTTAANTGILALSYGTNATSGDAGGKAYCPVFQAGMPAGDSFPDDVAPGDVLDVYGETDAYIPATCSAGDAGPGASMVPGIQLTKVNQVVRSSTKAPLPTPAVLTTSDISTLAAGSDASWLNQWGGVRVEVQNVSVMAQLGQLTDTYGHMVLNDGIQVGDKLYYVGYIKATDDCANGPHYPTNSPMLTSVTGFVYLDFCNWGLEPSDKCHDLQPGGDDCLSMYDAGAPSDAGDAGDAGPNPAAVCLH